MNKNLLYGFLIGAAAGLAYGILYAPESGKKTRKKLNKLAKEYNKNIETFIARSQDTMADVKDTIEELKIQAQKKLAQMIP